MHEHAYTYSAPPTVMLNAGRSIHNLVGKTSREVVASTIAVTFFVRRDAWTSLYVCGGILNAILSKVLKRVINQARPEGARSADPGMPSSHAMSLFFLGTFVACVLRNALGVLALAYATSARCTH